VAALSDKIGYDPMLLSLLYIDVSRIEQPDVSKLTIASVA
jgi:hypothetical protein